MRKTSTSFSANFDANNEDGNSALLEYEPKRQTMEFLKQFARSYHCELSLDGDVCDFILN